MSPGWRAPRSTEACLVWLASALPFLIEPLFAPGRFAGVSRAALAALPWIAWVGLPRATSRDRDGAGTEGRGPRAEHASPQRGSSKHASSSSASTAAASTSAPLTSAPLTSAPSIEPASTEPASRASIDGDDAPLAGALLDVALCLPPIALGSWIDLESGVASDAVVLFALGSAACVFALSLAARMARRSRAALRHHAVVWLALVALLPLLRAALELGGQPAFGASPAWMSWLARASPLAWVVARLDAASSAPGIGAILTATVLIAVAALGIQGNGASARRTA